MPKDSKELKDQAYNLWARGLFIPQIGKMLGVDDHQAIRLVKACERDAKARIQATYDVRRAQHFAELRAAKLAAWQAWQQSVSNGHPDMRALATIGQLLTHEAKLSGFIEPPTVNQTVNVQPQMQFAWGDGNASKAIDTGFSMLAQYSPSSDGKLNGHGSNGHTKLPTDADSN